MPVLDIRSASAAATTFAASRGSDYPVDIIAEESQWRVRPRRSASAYAAPRVIATRWRKFGEETEEASAVTADDWHVIGIALRSANLRLSVAGRAVLDGAAMPGTALVAGPGDAARCLFRGPCDELHLHAPGNLIAECAGELPDRQPARLFSRAAPIPDPTVERLAWTLLGAENIGGSVGQLYADCIGIAIIARLLSAAPANAPGDGPKVSPLPRWRLKRAMDYVEAHLADPVSLADLASATGLTRMHFAAQFRAATGLRPHEYLLRRRVERAQEMFAGGAVSVVDVALSVGFQTQSHFTTVFKRFTGHTPHAWHKAQVGTEPAADRPVSSGSPPQASASRRLENRTGEPERSARRAGIKVAGAQPRMRVDQWPR
jgi:AraC family transcriptional regulator